MKLNDSQRKSGEAGTALISIDFHGGCEMMLQHHFTLPPEVWQRILIHLPALQQVIQARLISKDFYHLSNHIVSHRKWEKKALGKDTKRRNRLLYLFAFYRSDVFRGAADFPISYVYSDNLRGLYRQVYHMAHEELNADCWVPSTVQQRLLLYEFAFSPTIHLDRGGQGESIYIAYNPVLGVLETELVFPQMLHHVYRQMFPAEDVFLVKNEFYYHAYLADAGLIRRNLYTFCLHAMTTYRFRIVTTK